jgi:dihydrodipicolinate synthase/N-acetylneuraminate lyase
MITYLSGAIYLFVSFVNSVVSDGVVGVVNTGTYGAVHYLAIRNQMAVLAQCKQ